MKKTFFSLFLAAALFALSPLTDAANSKSSLGNYAGEGALRSEETVLADCDTRSTPEITSPGGAARIKFSVDTDEKTEGAGSYSVEWKTAGDSKFFRVADFGGVYDCGNSSETDENGVSVRVKTTIKLDLYVNDVSLLKADHEGLYDLDFSSVGTVFLRVESGKNMGTYHAVNQTITGNGWQEIEFSFDHDNGVSGSFNSHKVTGMWISATANEPGLVIKVDNVRVCRYISEGYDAGDLSEYVPRGARMISTCDFDALSGEVVTEWFNSDFSRDVKLSGTSSLHLFTDGGDDERLFWGGLDLTASHVYDCLCFWVYVDDVDALDSWFIELNEIQDKEGYEFEFTDALGSIKNSSRGKLASGEWTMVRLALPFFSGRGELAIRHLRMVPRAKSGREANVYIDNVFLATREELEAFDAGYPETAETETAVETDTVETVDTAGTAETAETAEAATETETPDVDDARAPDTETAENAETHGTGAPTAVYILLGVAAVFAVGFAVGVTVIRRRNK